MSCASSAASGLRWRRNGSRPPRRLARD